MKFTIDNDHPLFALTPIVAEYSSEFLKHHGLNYFQFGRCYADGSILNFSNTSELAKLLFGAGFSVQSSFDEDHQKRPSYVFFWDEELPEDPVSLVRERLGIYHGMTILKRYKDYYDMIAFGMAKPRSNAMSYYFNYYKELEKFADQFIRTRTDLLSIHERQKLQLPSQYQDPNRLKLCLSGQEQRFTIKGRYGKTYATTREIFCLQYLEQGKSYKEVADILSISPRTIETYLGRIKERTGFNSREQIFAALCP